MEAFLHPEVQKYAEFIHFFDNPNKISTQTPQSKKSASLLAKIPLKDPKHDNYHLQPVKIYAAKRTFNPQTEKQSKKQKEKVPDKKRKYGKNKKGKSPYNYGLWTDEEEIKYDEF